MSGSVASLVRCRLQDYWALIKSLQTGLLLFSGIAGFASARCPVTSPEAILALMGSLFLAISGSTVLNMVFDRDIDSLMERTAHRPLPAGRLGVFEAAFLGVGLSGLGLLWSFQLSALYGIVVFAGLFFDVVVYTLWLKRRTPWSILWGGVSGGMPILAGRVLAVGSIDFLGLLLALAILMWIPTHIMTFGVKYQEEYVSAGVPVFPNSYGLGTTRAIIAASTVATVSIMFLVGMVLGQYWAYMAVLLILGGILMGMAAATLIQPSLRLNSALFKLASLFMLGALGLVVLG